MKEEPELRTFKAEHSARSPRHGTLPRIPNVTCVVDKEEMKKVQSMEDFV